MRLYQVLAYFVLLCINTTTAGAENFIHPGNIWYYFGDSASGGISLSHRPKQSDSLLEWTFELKPGKQYQWPYTGICRELNSNELRSFAGQDTLIADMRSNREGPLLFKLATFDPDRSTPDEPSSFRVLEHAVTVTTSRRQYRIPLKAFRIPDWYKTEKNIPPEDNDPFWDSLRLVQIIFNDTRRFNSIDTLQLYDLHLKRSEPRSGRWFIYLLVLIPAGLMTVLLLRNKKNNATARQACSETDIDIHPKKMHTVPSDWKRTLEFIEQQYTSQSLTIQKTAEALGFSESKLSRLINEKYPDGFRALIHEMRIKEGKRLLRESDMNIGEIAYTLGYAVPSHFNREFKKRCNVAPGVFRRSGDSENV